jgi:hypothetical protein
VATLFKHLRFAGVQIVTLAEGEISELHVGLKGTMNALARANRSGRRQWQEKRHQSPHPDELVKTRRGLETFVPRINQALMPSNRPTDAACWRRSKGAVAQFKTGRMYRSGHSR